jgi:hypothetical protein
MSFDLPDAAIELKKITEDKYSEIVYFTYDDYINEYKTLTFIGRAYIFPLPLHFIHLQRQNNSV